MISDKDLIALAAEARTRSWSPYSGFAVGAALLAADGRVYTGANIENAAYGPTVCAERVAFFTAVHDDAREFSAIAVVGGAAGEPPRAFTAPCGVCRQVMREFCADDFRILMTDGEAIRETTLAALLPDSFSPDNLHLSV